jgi:MFS family permease
MVWEARAVRGLAQRALAPLGAIAQTFANPGLRRIQLAYIGSILGSWSYMVALVVYAYAQGGAGAVALVSVLRMIPAAVLAPFTSTLADRFSRRMVMLGSNVLRAALMGVAAAIIAADGADWLVYALVCATSIAGTPFRPAQAALLPALARTPAELTAANVTSSTLEAIGTFVGPAIGGFLLAGTNTETVFAVNGASFLWSAALVVGIRVPAAAAKGSGRKGGILGIDPAAGFKTILGDRKIATLVGLYAAQTLIAGALTVFVIVTAAELLDGGAKTVGFLNSAIGVGGLVGGVAALTLAARGRLATDFGLGLALFGAPFLVIAAVPEYAPALVALAVLGLGNSLVDISAITLLQRIVPDEVLGRVLGVMQGILLGAIGIGAALAPLLIELVGARTTFAAIGAFPLVVAALGYPMLRQIDASTPPPALVETVRGVEIFASLPLVALDRLAKALVEIRLPQGAVVIREGEPGDRFYIVDDGIVEVQGNTLGPGASFGEIALLRDVPRTATVTAASDVILYALDRAPFLEAVTGHEPASAAADAVIAQRLGELAPEESDASLTTAAGAA